MQRPPQSNMVGDTLLFMFLVLSIGSIVRLGASIYLPAMPLIAESMHLSKAAISNTLTVYFVVFASFTLIAGMLSDAYGRRYLLLSGMLLFMLGSFVCALSESYEMLISGRIIQALGASMVPGTLMAMIRDACSEIKVVSLMGWLTVLSGLFLVAAPIIGGVLTHLFGWEANFWFLGGFTALVFLLAWSQMGETHHQADRTPLNHRETLQVLWQMLRARTFLIVLVPVISFYAVQGAFLAAVPFILMDEYGLAPVTFGISNINIVIGLFTGRAFGMHLLRRYGNEAVYHYGAYFALGIALLFGLTAIHLIGGLWNFLIISGLFAVVFGMIAPLGMKHSLSAFRSVSGIAAALQSSLLFIASALGSAITGMLMHLFENQSAESLFSLVTLCLCLIAAAGAFQSKIPS